MDQIKENPALGAGLQESNASRTSQTTDLDDTKSKQLGKLDSILIHFASGQSFHRFQAERLGDHCVHSTVSSLQNRHGIYFQRQWVKVPNRFGSQTRVMRYWLEGENLNKARKAAGLSEECAS